MQTMCRLPNFIQSSTIPHHTHTSSHIRAKQNKKNCKWVFLLRGITKHTQHGICGSFYVENDWTQIHFKLSLQQRKKLKCRIQMHHLVFKVLVCYWVEQQFSDSFQIFQCEINVIWIRDLSNEALNHKCLICLFVCHFFFSTLKVRVFVSFKQKKFLPKEDFF